MTKIINTQISGEGVRYLLVGAWNTVFGVAVFAVLWHLLEGTVGYGWVLLIAQVIAVLQAHWSQRTFVWRSKGRFFPELSRFALVYTATYFANLGLLATCVEWLGLPVLSSQIVITMFLVVVTFAINRTWTFRHRAAPVAGGAEDVEVPSVNLENEGRGI